MNYHKTSWLLVCFLFLPFASKVAFPQPLPRVVASGLMAPSKLLALPRGPLLVGEGGKGPHTGRVSMIDRDGNRATLIDGLPAGLAAPNNEPSGANGLVVKNRTLFIAIGSGDAVINGPAPGSEVPNPNRSSPILSSMRARSALGDLLWRVPARTRRLRDFGEGGVGFAAESVGRDRHVAARHRHSRLPPCPAARRAEQCRAVEPVRPRTCRLVRPLARRCRA